MTTAPDIIARQSRLESERMNFDSLWQDVARFVMPADALFNTERAPGQRVMDHVFDSTPISANERFAAAMQSMLTPATQKWHALAPIDYDLEDDHDVRVWCDEVTDILFAARYAPSAQFGQAIGQAFLSFGAFGNAVISIEDRRGQGLLYRAAHLGEVYWAESEDGTVDTIHRKLKITVRQAVQKFGIDSLPKQIADQVERNPDAVFDFIHCIYPMVEAPREQQLRQFAFASEYVSIVGKATVRRGGYRTFPYAIGRYAQAPQEAYGRGPGTTALPDIQMLQEMMRTHLMAAHMVVFPPVLLGDDGALQPFSLQPGALNYGGVTEDGRQRIHPFQSGGRLDISRDMIEDVRRRINDIFNVSLFQILVDKPAGMTATEAMIRAQEKGALLAPTGVRAQAELLGSMIRRELDILAVAGNLPPLPRVLQERGGMAALRVQYTSPVNQAQKAQDAVAILNYMSTVGNFAEAFPEMIDSIDGDAMARELADVSGVPDKILRTEEAVARIRADRKEQQDMASLVEAAPQVATAADRFASAGATAAAIPSSQRALLQ
jgi:hypothetical protein